MYKTITYMPANIKDQYSNYLVSRIHTEEEKKTLVDMTITKQLKTVYVDTTVVIGQRRRG